MSESNQMRWVGVRPTNPPSDPIPTKHIGREDLITKSWDLTAGTTTLLAAVAGKKHKIYGWDYEADTDGANEFSAIIGGVTTKFARRITKGVHAMTLIHPIVCDTNTALTFTSAGNTKLRLTYITE
jgi:hypothetical protein